MANEIVIISSIVVSKATGVPTNDKTTTQFTLTGKQGQCVIQNVGTSTEQIVFTAELIAEGISHMKLTNLDQTNYVDIGLNTPLTQIFARLQPGTGGNPGQSCLVPVYGQAAADSPVYYGKAHTGACDVRVTACGIT